MRGACSIGRPPCSPRIPRLTSPSATCSSDDQSRAAAKPAVFSGFVTARRLRGNGAGVAAWRGMQLTAHTRPATDRKQRGAALGTVALPTGATVGQSYLACGGNRDLCSADASTLRSRIGRSWRRVGHVEQHIRLGLKDHLHCLRSGRLIAVERSCADPARTPLAWRSTRAYGLGPPGDLLVNTTSRGGVALSRSSVSRVYRSSKWAQSSSDLQLLHICNKPRTASGAAAYRPGRERIAMWRARTD